MILLRALMMMTWTEIVLKEQGNSTLPCTSPHDPSIDLKDQW
jgi:hypothetical protein